MGSCTIRNPSIEPCALPYPFMGILHAGQIIALNMAAADVIAAAPGIGTALIVTDLGSAYTGPYDSTYQGFAANTGGNSGGNYTVSGTLTVTGTSALHDTVTMSAGKGIVGLGATSFDAAAGSTASVGGASNATNIGQAGKVTTVLGSLVLSQGLTLPVTTPAAGAYPAVLTDVLIKLPTQSGGITVTLPVSGAGKVYIIEANSDGAAHNITIAITGGTVNGTATITTNYGRRIVTCDGTNAISQ